LWDCHSCSDAAPPEGDWILIWSDEFDGASIDPAKWSYGAKPWGTTDNSPCLITPEDSYLSPWDGSTDGVLVLRSRMGTFSGNGRTYNFSCGWVYSKIWMTYGYLEIRAQYPIGKGQWPAWWMLREGWPPEFDIAEFRGANGPDNDYMTQAVYDEAAQWHSHHIAGDFSDWHIYGFEWGPGYVKWYIDGVLTYSVNDPDIPNQPMYVILSGGLDSNADASTGFPNYYVVDYFRWYQKDFTGPPAAPTNLTASITSSGILLNWEASADWDVNSYNIYSSTNPEEPKDLIATGITGTNYMSMELTDGTTYYYVVTSVDEEGYESISSNEVSETAIAFHPVTVENYSFEEPGIGKVKGWNGENGTNIPGWNSDDSSVDSGVERASTTHRFYRGFLMGNDPPVWQLTSEGIAAGKIYLLEADLWDTYGGETMTMSLFYINNMGQKIQLALREFPVGGLDRWDAILGTVVYRVDEGPLEAIGRNLGIMFDNNASGWVGMDNIRLSVGIDPELKGDLNKDGRVDLCDFAELSSGWQTSYNMTTLVHVASNWLLETSSF